MSSQSSTPRSRHKVQSTLDAAVTAFKGPDTSRSPGELVDELGMLMAMVAEPNRRIQTIKDELYMRCDIARVQGRLFEDNIVFVHSERIVPERVRELCHPNTIRACTAPLLQVRHEVRALSDKPGVKP